VAISYTSKDPTVLATELSKEYNVKVTAYRCEASSSGNVNRMVEDVEKAYGKKVDIGVANAGEYFPRRRFVELLMSSVLRYFIVERCTRKYRRSVPCLHFESGLTGPPPYPSLFLPLSPPPPFSPPPAFPLRPSADLQQVFSVNTFGPYYLARALTRSWLSLPIDVTKPSSNEPLDIPAIQGTKLDKQILFVSSVSGLAAMTPQRQTAYNASKAALTMMSKVSDRLTKGISSGSPLFENGRERKGEELTRRRAWQRNGHISEYMSTRYHRYVPHYSRFD